MEPSEDGGELRFCTCILHMYSASHVWRSQVSRTVPNVGESWIDTVESVQVCADQGIRAPSEQRVDPLLALAYTKEPDSQE